jgi:hypothetical protein
MQPDWVKNPTKKQVIAITLLWFAGLILSLLPMTNFFTESPLHKKYLVFGLFILMATYTIFCVYRNYIKNHSKT